MKDLYVVTKFTMASSVEEALKKEKKTKVSEVWIDGDWKKHKNEKLIDKRIYKRI